MIKLLPAKYGNVSNYIISLVKTYILFGCVLGLSFGTIRALKFNNTGQIIDDLVYKGFLPALVFIFFIGLLDIFQKVKCYLKFHAIAFDVRQVREFVIIDNPQTVFFKMKELLINVPKINVVLTDINSGVIKALVKRSWKSLGEKLTVNIKIISDSESRVTLLSEPKIKLAFIDYSKNFENVEMVIALMKQEE